MIERYSRGPALLKVALARIPATAMQWRPGSGNWSGPGLIVHRAG